jgi:hypothetical protein
MVLRVLVNIFGGLLGIAIGIAILKGLGSLVGHLIGMAIIRRK